MRKFASILILLFVLSISAFAEGDIPLGGKSCPQGQTCSNDGDEKSDNSIYQDVLDFLKTIFG